MIFSPFDDRIGLLHVRDCRKDAFGEDYMLKFSVGERSRKCDKENREWWWHQIKSIYI